ncbi:GNAT family N-acetyltransferase [Cellulomonas xiejunii]|uniref:GNAT family N-acetyltransferase n=1 Tax=Cellulomonas xiejunii TaxID=2968083 RepID=A0ABY5KNA4_9CELL|nr:GNAT family N-acetyltransferase [Cellulomonas xiejunii]MCC2321391.1 GNAT family N-acetyltransferase [Cellulomonas xiejunii]UUI71972.1 GNAT family N-acetyltransferase [Cellulomonas xiejunii]
MITVSPARPGDLTAAAEVLAEAFVDDPVTGAVLRRTGADRLRCAQHLFVALLRPAIADGTVDLARRGDDSQVLGVAIWEAPGAVTTVARLAAQLPSFWRACGAAGLVRALATKRAVERYRPRQPHWYLQEIGVAADARGQGIGGALLDARLADVDRQGAGAYLESSTERNRRLYRRYGFLDGAPVRRVPAAPVTMWRPPSSDQAPRPAATTPHPSA